MASREAQCLAAAVDEFLSSRPLNDAQEFLQLLRAVVLHLPV